jgi:hypothetical protein
VLEAQAAARQFQLKMAELERQFEAGTSDLCRLYLQELAEYSANF